MPENVIVVQDPVTTYVNVYVRAGRVADGLKQGLDGRPEPASNRHLDDAIAVRDRLLDAVLATARAGRRQEDKP